MAMAYEVPMVTLILNIYEFLCLAAFYFLAKVQIFTFFFDAERVVAI